MHMIVLNVVCFGPKYQNMHEHVLNALDAGRIAKSGRFRLDEWPDTPQPGMLDRSALVTYVTAHGGCWPDGTSGLGVKGAWASFEEFGSIGGSAVVLDACDTATDHWLYRGGLLRAECRSLKNKFLLGGSGLAEAPIGPGGARILNALLDLLTDVDGTAMSDEGLRSLLMDVRENAIAKSAPNSKVKTAYAIRKVTEQPSRVW
jgi:hypothetical protein